MSKFSNYSKAVELTPCVAAEYYHILASSPVLSCLSGVQLAAVASIMYEQKLYGFNQACQELDLI